MDARVDAKHYPIETQRIRRAELENALETAEMLSRTLHAEWIEVEGFKHKHGTDATPMYAMTAYTRIHEAVSEALTWFDYLEKQLKQAVETTPPALDTQQAASDDSTTAQEAQS